MFGLGLGIAYRQQFLAGVSRPALSLDFTTSDTLDPRITFSRTSLATMYDETGKLTYCPNNLLLQSNNPNSASWGTKTNLSLAAGATDPDGGTTAYTYTATDANGRLLQAVSTTAAVPHIASIWIKRRTGSGPIRWESANVGAGDVIDVTSEWQRVAYVADTNTKWPATSTYYFGIRIDTAGDAIDIAFGKLEVVTYQTTPRPYVATTSAAYYGPRRDFDPVTLECKGLLIEEARTNVVLHNRDLTQAAWTSTNITPVKDQTGIDGVANSASKITATAANGTCLQAITLASSQRFQTAYVKRLVGSGTVEMTTDGGTTWVAITVTAGWTRVEIPEQTLADPSAGFRIVTSGDSIAVDCVQNETGEFATSVLITSSASVTRAADSASMTGTNFSDWYNQSEGTFVVDFSDGGAALGSAANIYAFTANQASTSYHAVRYNSNTLAIGAVTIVSSTQASLNIGTMIRNTPMKVAFAYKEDDFAASANGGSVVTDSSGSLPSPVVLHLGNHNGDTSNMGVRHIKSFTYYAERKSDADLQLLTTA